MNFTALQDIPSAIAGAVSHPPIIGTLANLAAALPF